MIRHAKHGVRSTLIAIAAIVLLSLLVTVSYVQEGKAATMIGALGICAWILSGVGDFLWNDRTAGARAEVSYMPDRNCMQCRFVCRFGNNIFQGDISLCGTNSGKKKMKYFTKDTI